MRYFAVVEKSDGADVVTFPDCDGCFAQADKGQSVDVQAADVLEAWLEARLKLGKLPPLPGPKPRAPKGKRVIEVPLPAKLAVRIELRNARHSLALTQQQLADRAGVSQNQIAKLENPDTNPTIETLEKVAAALGMWLEIGLMPTH